MSYFAYCVDCDWHSGTGTHYWALERAERHTDVFHDHTVFVDTFDPQRDIQP